MMLKNNMENKHISYCGYDCSLCPVFIASKVNDLDTLRKILFISNDKEISVDTHGCYGCCDERSKNFMCLNCYIKSCAQDKLLNSCGKCSDFPCQYLKNNISVKTMETLENIKNNK